jgi:hypothetical protein
MRNRPHRDNGEGQAGTPPVSYPRVEKVEDHDTDGLPKEATTPTGLKSRGMVADPGFGNPGLYAATPLGLPFLIVRDSAASHLPRIR